MNWPHEFLVGLHSTGLTWATIIPLTALLVRLNVATFLNYPARITILRQLALKPILQGLFRSKVAAVGSFNSLDKNTQDQIVLNTIHKMYAKWGCSSSNKWLPLLQLPVFVSFMETIRAIGGSPVGFFGAIKQLLIPTHRPAVGGAETGTQIDIAASPQVTSSEATSLQAAPSEDQLPPEVTEMSALQPWFEPSFAVEGLSWCPDLTVPDPTGILPVAVPLMMLATIVNSLYGVGGLRKSFHSSRQTSLLFRLSVVLTASIAWVAPLMPAGLLYYWTCSSTFALLSQLFFDWRYPIKAIAPAKGKLPPQKK
jgi:inner membrane protein COX18